ncbi:MAG TPA: RNB domain-containing ribonuclease, partial [Leptospiraceae bacterium]|nr:RNB domain-containing ribonuclease [Leptospiraceae bacterium]
MNKIIAKTYRYLKANSGKDISWNLLMEDLAEKKKDKKHGKKHSGDHKEDLMIFLNFLESELLIEKHKKHLHVSKNFKITGKIFLSKWGDGFVKLRSQKEVFVPREFTEGAIPGDTVEIIPLGFGKRGRLEGEVREVIKRGRTFYRLKIVDADEHYFYGIILDQNGEEKEGFLRKKSLLADVVRSIKKDDVLIVKFREDSFQSGNLYETSFLRFEEGDSRDRDYNRILLKYDFHQNYPEEIILNFPENPGPENTEDWGERADLRNLWTATIDGATSKDFDDAVSIETEGDIVRFYVHIADVGHYVRLHTPLDEEALKRATSVYLTDHVVPMLPPVLSEDLCSLVAGKDRLAFTAEMTGDWNGRIFSARFYKSIIKVDRRYTYESAEEEIIKNEEGSRICLLNRLAEGQRKFRMEEGRVDLNLKEVYFSTAEDGSVKEVRIRERLKSHMLIEELMLSANQKTAEFIRKKKAPALFRIHEVMDEDKLETLNSFLKIYGFRNQISSVDYKEIRKVQKAVSGHESERVFNYILLRSFMQA